MGWLDKYQLDSKLKQIANKERSMEVDYSIVITVTTKPNTIILLVEFIMTRLALLKFTLLQKKFPIFYKHVKKSNSREIILAGDNVVVHHKIITQTRKK